MRVFKPTYSKPLSERAKIIIRKGEKFAKFKDTKGRTVEARLTKKADKILCETENWHIGFKDNLNICRDVQGYPDQQATQGLANEIQELINCKVRNIPIAGDLQKFFANEVSKKTRNDLTKCGLLDSQSMTADKTLSEYIEEFKDFLTKKERDLKHIREVTGTLKRIFKDCGFLVWTDITPVRLMNFLDELRNGGKGISKRRYNGLLSITKAFCRWMVKQKKAAGSPIDYLDGLDNPQTDQRHARRVLELNDLFRFLEATSAGETKFGLTGQERNFIYRFAIETALRKSDFQRLRVKDCDFATQTIIIEAGRIKNKQRSFIYLKPETSIELQQYCANKLPDTKVFHFPDKPEKMVRFDLENTAVKDADGKVVMPAIPYIDKFGLFFDFHALRHQSASMYGMNPDTEEATRQQLTRHKSPTMARHYTHTFEEQQRKAVAALPDLRQPSRQIQIKTGTDFLSISCFKDGQKRISGEQG